MCIKYESPSPPFMEERTGEEAMKFYRTPLPEAG